MKLYYHPNSQPSRTCLALARHLGLSLELEKVDLLKGEQKEDAYLRLNPNGKVPTLVDGDLTVWESGAILAYLAAKGSDPGLHPADPARRARVDQWCFWAHTTWNRPLATLSMEMFKGLMGLAEPDTARQEEAKDEFRRHAAILDAQLSGKKWVLGEQLTLADFALASMLTYWEPAGAPLDAFDQVRTWYGRVEELPAWQETQPKLPG